MKKFLLGLLLAFLIATPVYGYNVVKGDTPFGLWGINWKTELAKYGISDPTKLPVGLEVSEQKLGATPTPTSSAFRKYVESPDFYLYSPAVSLDTTITLNTLKDIYGNILTMTDIGTLGYGRIDPDSASISESITFSGITANSDGTYTLTGVKSTLAKYPYTQTSGLKRSHSINAIFRLTNTAAFYDGFANKDNNEIVDGYWTFTSPTTSIFYVFPTVSSSAYTELPTSNGQLATKYYVDTVGAGGFTSANVSTTRGLSVDGSSPEKVGINASSTTGGAFDANGKYYQAIGNALTYTGNAIAVSTSTIVSQIASTTATAGLIPIVNSSNKIIIPTTTVDTVGQVLVALDGLKLPALDSTNLTKLPFTLISSSSAYKFSNTAQLVMTSTIPAETKKVICKIEGYSLEATTYNDQIEGMLFLFTDYLTSASLNGSEDSGAAVGINGFKCSISGSVVTSETLKFTYGGGRYAYATTTFYFTY